MAEFEGIDKALQLLEPHMKELTSSVDAERKRFDNLMAQEHDLVGRLLKCHLVIENYMERYLAKRFVNTGIAEARLSFYQKAQLLPDNDAPALAKSGILRLNAIRNKFAHQLDVPLTDFDLGPIAELVAVARKGISYPTPIEKIEVFCSIAFTMMLILPDQLESVVRQAMGQVRKVGSN